MKLSDYILSQLSPVDRASFERLKGDKTDEEFIIELLQKGTVKVPVIGTLDEKTSIEEALNGRR